MTSFKGDAKAVGVTPFGDGLAELEVVIRLPEALGKHLRALGRKGQSFPITIEAELPKNAGQRAYEAYASKYMAGLIAWARLDQQERDLWERVARAAREGDA